MVFKIDFTNICCIEKKVYRVFKKANHITNFELLKISIIRIRAYDCQTCLFSFYPFIMSNSDFKKRSSSKYQLQTSHLQFQHLSKMSFSKMTALMMSCTLVDELGH